MPWSLIWRRSAFLFVVAANAGVFFPSPLVGEGGTKAQSAFVTGEGSVSADRKPLIRRASRATFSHKGRREEELSPGRRR
jgi:hypothetical protein